MSGQRITADSITLKPDEIARLSIDFTLFGLDVAELLTGTPTITEVGTTDLTIATKVVNVNTFINRRGKVVAVGKGVQCYVSGQKDGVNYLISVGCNTNGSPAQFLEGTIPVECKSVD